MKQSIQADEKDSHLYRAKEKKKRHFLGEVGVSKGAMYFFPFEKQNASVGYQEF